MNIETIWEVVIKAESLDEAEVTQAMVCPIAKGNRYDGVEAIW